MCATDVLAGDIGGTKTRLAIVEVRGDRARIQREAEFPSRDYASFDTLLERFLGEEGGRGVAAAFGLAGPVQGNIGRATNLPWLLDAQALQRSHGLARCILINDLEATAWGLPALDERDLLTLQAGAPNACGNMAVIAAGTGLGEAGLYWDGQNHHPYATEGGHASFSPANEIESELLEYLRTQHGHVSWERVVSGMGIPALYHFLCSQRKIEPPQWLVKQMRACEPAATISEAALNGKDPLCRETLEWFVRLYGAEAGNLALKALSSGGLYLGGGIAPKILPLLQEGAFIAAFLDKGRMRPLLEAMPVRVILNDRAALYGAALRAAAPDEKTA